MKVADVIVVGGGPAGVAAALELRRQGVERLLLLDREPRLGGATRHCMHSPFGMREFARVYFGPAYSRRLEYAVQEAGIEVRTGHSVVALQDGARLVVSSAAGVQTLAADRILISTGARELPRSARLLPGDRPIGILSTGALQAYLAFHGLLPFRQPVIVGSELVSMSAVLTCITHRARPVGILEPREHAQARAPWSWFPIALGIPFYTGVEVLDIMGRGRVEAVRVCVAGEIKTLACDGVLLTGQFTPEATLFLQSSLGVDQGSAGPAVDQHGRTADPLIFAAGNVLRAVETGGWAFREGRSVAAALAADLRQSSLAQAAVPVSYDDPIKFVVPSTLRREGDLKLGLRQFQLRFQRRASGTLILRVDGKEVWRRSKHWRPERRVLAPIPAAALQAQDVHFQFIEEL